MSRHPPDCRRLEPFGVVCQRGGQRPVRLVGNVQREIELGTFDGHLLDGDRHTRKDRRRRGGAQDEHDLEQGRVARQAHRLQRLDHTLERHFGVREGIQGDLLNLVQQVTEAGIRREVRPQGQGVEEAADQPRELSSPPVSRRHTHDDITFSRVAVEQHHVGGEQHGKERRTLAAAELPQTTRCRQRQVTTLGPAQSRSGCLPVAIGRQGEGRRPLQLTPPVGKLLLKQGPGQPPALPEGEVSVLEREVGQWRGLAGRESGVQSRQLVQEERLRPRIEDDVVRDDQQGVLLRSDAKERGSQQGVQGEVERPMSLLS